MTQTLNQLFQDFPHIKVATEKDNQAILDFYHQTEMATEAESIKYGRGNNFFNFLNERCKENLVFTLWDDENKLNGVAVVSYRQGYINQELTWVGYFGDLRVTLNRKLIREWRKAYSTFITHSPSLAEAHYCRFYQTVTIDSNAKAKANLVTNNIGSLRYVPYESYKMINIFGRFNIFSFAKLIIQTPNKEELFQLIPFLNSNDSKRMFGRYWTEELEHRLSYWQNFSTESFRVVKDKQNQVLAVASFWNPIKSKQVTVNKVPWYLKIIVPLLNFIPFVQIKNLPKENQALEILYLNQIVFKDKLEKSQKRKIISQLIHQEFNKDFNMLAYCDFNSQQLLENSFDLFKHSIDMTMYTVHHSEDGIQIRDPLIKKGQVELDPAFEMSLV